MALVKGVCPNCGKNIEVEENDVNNPAKDYTGIIVGSIIGIVVILSHP